MPHDSRLDVAAPTPHGVGAIRISRGSRSAHTQAAPHREPHRLRDGAPAAEWVTASCSPVCPTETLLAMADKAADREAVPPGYKVIFRRYIIKDGRKVYPKNAKAFRLVVKDDT